MRRRKFLNVLGSTAIAWPLLARAQQPAMPVVEYIDAGSPTGSAHFVAAFREGLSKAGLRSRCAEDHHPFKAVGSHIFERPTVAERPLPSGEMPKPRRRFRPQRPGIAIKVILACIPK